ncbi:MAG: hypothetical protein J6A28_00230 [Clostridia bacterium]|nr:hypothetical protein [Clostridia bacterium]
MIKIKFQVDKNVIARYLIASSRMPIKLTNDLWEKYQDSYKKLKCDFRSQNVDADIVNELMNSNYFKSIYNESIENCERIEKNWREKEEIVQRFIKNICKKEIDLQVSANIVSPRLCMGRSVGQNAFFWGHKRGLSDENYDIVYLIHEALHSRFEKDDLSHAIIEKIADIGLATYLNGRAYSCHEFTRRYHDLLEPYWNGYLGNLQNDKNLVEMNIDEFTDYVQKQFALIKE